MCGGLFPKFLDVLKDGFKELFETDAQSNPLKTEYQPPIFIDERLKGEKMSAKVLKTNNTSYGLIHREDVATV